MKDGDTMPGLCLVGGAMVQGWLMVGLTPVLNEVVVVGDLYETESIGRDMFSNLENNFRRDSDSIRVLD